VNSDDCEAQPKKEGDPQLQGYGCGGAIHIKFSIKREAINVVYKHNPIHSSPPAEERYVATKAFMTTVSNQWLLEAHYTVEHGLTLPAACRLWH
jgi:hypothetical protein